METTGKEVPETLPGEGRWGGGLSGSSPGARGVGWSPAKQEKAAETAGHGLGSGPWAAGGRRAEGGPRRLIGRISRYIRRRPISRHRRQRGASASSPTHTAPAHRSPRVQLVLGSRGAALTHPDRVPRDLHSPGWFPKPSPIQDPRQRCPWPSSTHEESGARRGVTQPGSRLQALGGESSGWGEGTKLQGCLAVRVCKWVGAPGLGRGDGGMVFVACGRRGGKARRLQRGRGAPATLQALLRR